MMTGFLPRKEINDLNQLFGRSQLISQLLTLANNRYSVSITGLRRFGKTSLLKCINTSLRKDENSKVYPILLDFKEVGSIIKGTDNVYKYIVSCFVATLFKDNYFVEAAEFKKIKIVASGDWEDIFESLENVNAVRIQGLFEEIIMFFSELLDKTILLLIDEYEWLFRFSFDQPVGFMKLRNFSSRLSSTGISPFSFWIVGATPWDYLCTLTGSGELNVIDAPPIHLGPIDYESFCHMWKSEIDNLNETPDLIKNSVDFAYHATGGIPFYGKLIGSYILSNHVLPNYTILNSHLHELMDSLQNEERVILFELSRLPRNYKLTKYVHELINKGLIKKNAINFDITIGFLKEFLKSVDNVTSTSDLTHPSISNTQILTDKITSLITNINKTHHNKKGAYIFEPVVDEAALIKDLSTSCYSLDLFSNFACSLYKIVFERTKDTKGGIDQTKAKLPNSFKRGNQFIDIVDIMRHSLGGGHLMDTFTPRSGQITKAKMLEILVGNNNEPNTPEEFHNLQLSTLKLFESELVKLNAIVRAIT